MEEQETKVTLEELVASGQGDTRVSLGVAMPAELKLAITQHAEAAGKSARRVALEILANAFAIEVPASLKSGPAKTGRSEEEKKAARKAKAAERRQLIKQLLAAHRAKTESEDEDEDEDEE